MANWKRIGLGILTGGLSEIAYGAKDTYDKAKKSSDSPYTLTKQLEDEAASRGMSVEEFIQAYPEFATDYYDMKDASVNDSQNSILDRIASGMGDASAGAASAVEKYIDNVTGERDSQENALNRDFQRIEADKAREWEAEQAKIAREWDSIGAQMERAAQAGVNPISIAMQNGGINGSLGTSIPSSPGIPAGSSGLMHNGLLDIASTVFSGIGTFAEQRLKQSQADDIVAMRKYNIAEKQANISHLQELCKSVDLSNTSQSIQNKWLDSMNQVSYINMLKDLGVKDSQIRQQFSLSQLNLEQANSVKENLQMSIQRFNQTLPLEVQLTEAEINLTKRQADDVYEEIVLRHLQQVEQENRNRQSASEADSAQIEMQVAKANMEDAIASFHNDTVKGAAEAGVSYLDYLYYGSQFRSFHDAFSKTQRSLGRFSRKNRDFDDSVIESVNDNIIVPYPKF